MRGSDQVVASLLAGLLLFNAVLAQPLLVKRVLRSTVSDHSSSQYRRPQRTYLGDETFGSHKPVNSQREKRVVKEIAFSIGSGVKSASVAGLKALGSASAGTVGAIGSASAGTLKGVAGASAGALKGVAGASAGTVLSAGKAGAGLLGALGAASLGAVGAASGLGVKAIGAASSGGVGLGLAGLKSLGGVSLAGAKSLGGVSLGGAKVVGAAGAKVAAKTGFAVAKAAITVGIAKFILSFIFGKINQLIDLRGKLLGGLGLSNPKSNNILSVSLPASAFQPAHQADASPPSDDKDEDLPDIDPEKVSIQVPDAFFAKGFSVVNRASPVIGDVIQNTAERLARFIKQLKPILGTSLLGSNPVRDEETTLYSFGDDDSVKSSSSASASSSSSDSASSASASSSSDSASSSSSASASSSSSRK